MFEKYKLKKQIKILEKSVNANDFQAMYDLAMIYLDGSLLPKNSDRAMLLLQTAADNGHIPSKTYLITNKIACSVAVGSKAIDEIINTLKK